MLFEVFAFIGGISLLLFALAEASKAFGFGLVGAFLLFFLSLWCLLEGVWLQDSVANVVSGTETHTGIMPCCDLQTTAINETIEIDTTTTTTPHYTELQWPYDATLRFREMFGIVMILLAMFSLTRYGIMGFRGRMAM